MRGLDFSSWQSLLLTLIGLALFTLISIGIRLLMMVTIQQRRERMNRQINERLRALIAAYRTLGGSFTGTLTVNPVHMKELRQRASDSGGDEDDPPSIATWDRPRCIRDAVEAALSDIILLGTEEQVKLASKAIAALVAGEPVRTDDLVISLRNFIREALDLDPISPDLHIPMQGPARPAGSNSGRKAANEGTKGEGRGGGSNAGGGMGGGGMGGGGMGGGVPGLGNADADDTDPKSRT